MSKPRDLRQRDLWRPPLDEVIDMNHPLVILAQVIDWDVIEGRLGSIYRAGPGQPPLPIRLVTGLLMLKHLDDLSDDALCRRWLENPYFQYFCGEESFCHALPFDRSTLSRWRRRLGDEALMALIADRLSAASDRVGLARRNAVALASNAISPIPSIHPAIDRCP